MMLRNPEENTAVQDNRLNSHGSMAALLATAPWWLAVILLFLLVHIKIEWFLIAVRNPALAWLFDGLALDTDQQAISLVVGPIRGIMLLLSLAVLVTPVLIDLRNGAARDSRLDWPLIGRVAGAAALLCVLFAPGVIDGLASEYANSSLVLFSRATSVNFRQRFLMPALANILFFRGGYWFRLFSWLWALALLFLVAHWFKENGTPLPLWQLVALGTTSFVYFQIVAPGYPDVLVFAFILLASSPSLSARSRLSLFALSLAAHEASLIIWAAMAFSLFERKDIPRVLGVAAAYLALLIVSNHGLAGVWAGRQSGGLSNPEWVLQNPLRELTGLFFAFKALWAILAVAVWRLVSQRNYQRAAQIGAVLAAGVVMTFLGVDTSRLFGWAFYAFLVSWKEIAAIGRPAWDRFLKVALIANLLIPSFYVQLNFTPMPARGLYAVVVGFIHSLFAG